MKRVIIMNGVYRDSITLLRISKEVQGSPGVRQAAVVMGTPLNLRVLRDSGFEPGETDGPGSDDLVVAIEADDEISAARSLEVAQSLLKGDEQAKGVAEGNPHTIAQASELDPRANLAVISVPGRFARREAVEALNRGLNVFLFSSNVSRSDERELKELALSKHLLMMGPDCGTAVIDHASIGFGNSLRPGEVGIVSASGTGLQQVATMVHAAGLGVSQAIGTGGADLSEEVGGLMTIEGIRRLEADPETKVIVLISKPPSGEVQKKVVEEVRSVSKPSVIVFLGTKERPSSDGKVHFARTLDGAAAAACSLLGHPITRPPEGERPSASIAKDEATKLAPGQRFVRGLYAGGTLCFEAQVVLSPMVGDVWSNSPLERRLTIQGEGGSTGNTVIDMGAEEFVIGRAHPMIDFTLRKMRFLTEARDPETAVILFDVELGVGSNPDPAGELVPAILEARRIASAAGRHLTFVASIVGTDQDFQGLTEQRRALADAGVILMGSNVEAAEVAGRIVENARRSGRA